jgi:hypothetical protein
MHLSSPPYVPHALPISFFLKRLHLYSCTSVIQHHTSIRRYAVSVTEDVFRYAKKLSSQSQEWRTEENCGSRVHYSGSQSSIPEPSEHESVRTDRQCDVQLYFAVWFGTDDSRGLRIIAISN